MHYNPCQYLQCVGNAGIWRLLSVVGDNPAVRRAGGVSREGDSLSRMIMSGTGDVGARGEKSPAKYTHIDQQDTYFAVDSSSYFVFKSKSSA